MYCGLCVFCLEITRSILCVQILFCFEISCIYLPLYHQSTKMEVFYLMEISSLIILCQASGRRKTVFYLFFAVLSDDKSCFWSAFYQLVTRNLSGKICRQSLMSPSNSAFMYLFNTGHDDAFITMTGFDYVTQGLIM